MLPLIFFFNDTATTEIYTLSLHDALPICVPLVHQAMQHLEEQADVLEVEARRRLVEDVEGAARVALGQLGSQFDALRLAPRERRGGLAQVDVSQSYVVEQLEFRVNARLVLEEF